MFSSMSSVNCMREIIQHSLTKALRLFKIAPSFGAYNTASTSNAHEAQYLLSLLEIATALAISWTLYYALLARRSPLRQFSGPPAWPLVGNFLSIYNQRVETLYTKWSKQYGDVIRVQIGATPALIVNTADAAKDIFTRNSRDVASRPQLFTFHKIISSQLGTTVGGSGYDNGLKRSRKSMAAELSKPAVTTNLGNIDYESKQLMLDLFTHGNAGQTAIDIYMYITRMSMSLSLTICYGRQTTLDDPITNEITYVEDRILALRSPAMNYLDHLPVLRVLDFMGLYSFASRIRDRRDAYCFQLNAEVEEKIKNGTFADCLYTKNHFSSDPLTQEELSMVLVTFLAGGLSTVVNTVRWCLTLLASRPELQETAYNAIREHYPTVQMVFNAAYIDKEEVPYLSALVRECLRYYCPARTALPRKSTNGFSYKGRYCPKDIMVILNVWACNMDAKLYGDPEIFRPERWLENPDLPHFTFGLGFRKCAGYPFALREVYLVLMRVIAAFAIRSGSENLDSNPITGCHEATDLVSGPGRFKMFFVPRDADGLQAVLYNKE